MAKLTDRGLSIEDKKQAEVTLSYYNYYWLINGFKHPFLLTDEEKENLTEEYKVLRNINKHEEYYREGSTLQQIVALAEFDTTLRHLYLPFLLNLEQHLKNLITYELSYYITYQLPDSIREQNPNQHDLEFYHIEDLYPDNNPITTFKEQTIKKFKNQLIPKLETIIKENRFQTASISHYRDNHGYVPLWVLISELSFGEVSKFYAILAEDIQLEIIKKLININHSSFKKRDKSKFYRDEVKKIHKTIYATSLLRNYIAHNRRVYQEIFNNKQLKDLLESLRVYVSGVPHLHDQIEEIIKQQLAAQKRLEKRITDTIALNTIKKSFFIPKTPIN